MKNKYKLIIFLLFALIFFNFAFAIPLPMRNELFSQQKIGIITCGHLDKGEKSNIFPGLRLSAQEPEEVFAINKGIVLAIYPLDVFLSCEVLIADSSDARKGWLYRYLDYTRLNVAENDEVAEGAHIGNILNSSLELYRVSFDEKREIWMPAENPLNSLSPLINDTIPPVIEEIDEEIFKFKSNQGSGYLSANNLFGEVDIICKASDVISKNKTSVYRIEYKISGKKNIPQTFAYQFDFPLIQNFDSTAIYVMDGKVNSDENNFYYNITNLNGNPQNCWDTTEFPDGLYRVIVSVYDLAGNKTTAEMDVEVKNDPIAEILYFSATYEGSFVFLDWETENEKPGISYEIYRNSLQRSDIFEPITDFPIEAMASSNSRYSHIDSDVDNHSVEQYNYQLRLLRENKLERILATTSVIDKRAKSENFLKIHQNQPNPFNPETEITYELYEPGVISINIYDSAGKMIKKIAMEESKSPGIYQVHWNGRDGSNIPVPSGIYFCQVDINPLNSFEIYSQIIRMILLK